MCMCALDAECSSFAPGHAIHLIQLRVSAATPSGWSDAIVSGIDEASGTISVTTLDGRSATLWHRRAGEHVGTGDPVAFHDRYRVLAAGATRLNVAVLSPLDRD